MNKVYVLLTGELGQASRIQGIFDSWSGAADHVNRITGGDEAFPSFGITGAQIWIAVWRGTLWIIEEREVWR